MTRDEAFAQYRPVRLSIRRVLGLAAKSCTRADMTRAARQLGLWSAGKIEMSDEEEPAEMLIDVALFEPNQRGRVAYESFYLRQGEQFDAVDRLLAEPMRGAWFSLFRYAARHEAAGVWLEDLLDANRRLWLMDEGLEGSAEPGMVFGMRLFDAGLFHAGFGIVVLPDEETIDLCVTVKARSGRLPFRHSLAATLYGDKLRAEQPPGPELEWIVQALIDGLGADIAGSRPGRRGQAAHKRPRRGS